MVGNRRQQQDVSLGANRETRNRNAVLYQVLDDRSEFTLLEYICFAHAVADIDNRLLATSCFCSECTGRGLQHVCHVGRTERDSLGKLVQRPCDRGIGRSHKVPGQVDRRQVNCHDLDAHVLAKAREH